ncbi:MAG TPA: hypothetical protein VF167_00320 [Longimicrobiaceae bacterium]
MVPLASSPLLRRWIALLREWREEALQQRAWRQSLRAESDTNWELLAGRQHFAIFPRADVDACRGDLALQAANDAAAARLKYAAVSRSCFGCGRAAEELEWIFFQSPLWTWTQQCGRAGWIVYCASCDNQVCFHRLRMS